MSWNARSSSGSRATLALGCSLSSDSCAPASSSKRIRTTTLLARAPNSSASVWYRRNRGTGSARSVNVSAARDELAARNGMRTGAPCAATACTRLRWAQWRYFTGLQIVSAGLRVRDHDQADMWRGVRRNRCCQDVCGDRHRCVPTRGDRHGRRGEEVRVGEADCGVGPVDHDGGYRGRAAVAAVTNVHGHVELPARRVRPGMDGRAQIGDDRGGQIAFLPGVPPAARGKRSGPVGNAQIWAGIRSFIGGGASRSSVCRCRVLLRVVGEDDDADRIVEDR